MAQDTTNQTQATFVASTDAILPFMYNQIKWGVPNTGDNKETSNLSMARVFDKIGEHLQAMSVRTDCFVPGPPTVEFAKSFHNMFVRLNQLIDESTKPDNIPRLAAAHVTNERRAFKIYPVRYFDVKNDYCRRYIELCLQGLGNISQLSENGWENDWSEETAIEMKKLFREAYRLMCMELFQVPYTDAMKVFDNKTPFYLTQAQFDNYSVKHIPTIEWMKFPPLGSVLTEDEMRLISTPNVPVAPGVPENDPNSQNRIDERQAQLGATVQ